MADTGFAFPFDLSHLSILKYEHLGKEIGFREVMRVREQLKNKITTLINKGETDSPVLPSGRFCMCSSRIAGLYPHFFRRTSSSGAAHGYGSISISPGSATRGPIPLGQMNSQSGPKRTRS